MRRARRRITVVLVLLVPFYLASCGHGVHDAPRARSSAGPAGDAQDFSAAQATLSALDRAVAADDGRSASALDDPRTNLAGTIVANSRMLGIRDLRLRYVDVEPTYDASAEARFGTGAWVASVAVSYRLPVDAGPTEFETAFVFVPGSTGSARIAATGGYHERGALWLQGPVHVRRDAQVLLITAASVASGRYWALAHDAARAVDQVLHPTSPGVLVFEVPQSQQQLEQNLSVPAGGDDLIAGVTGSVGGSSGPRAPIHSFFNRGVMNTEGLAGARVVVTHEAALQATRAPVASMPLWMEEGFADFVALDHADVSMDLADKEIVRRVRAHGPPRHLPTPADFDPSGSTVDRLNAVYESAWLACVYIANTWGESALLRIFDDLEHGGRLDAVLRQAVGLDTGQFVMRWRSYLTQLARRA